MVAQGSGISDRQHGGLNEQSDPIEADIMTFSDLDLRRLGLATEKNIEPRTHSDKGQSHSLPNQQRRPKDPRLGRLSNPNLRSGEIPRVPGSIYPDIDSTHSPNLFHDPVLDSANLPWQESWASSETENAQGILGQEGNGARSSPTAITPQGLSQPSYQSHFTLLPENQQQGLPRRRSRYFRDRAYPLGSSAAIEIPNASDSTTSTSDPLQRWRNSPPETEPASMSAIVNALRDMPLRSRSSNGSLRSQRVGSRPGSIASHGSMTSCSSAGSNSSTTSALLRASTDIDRARSRVAKRTRGTRAPATQGTKQEKRSFHCTFCCDSFKSKYDWSRHEKSLHLNLDSWKCMPFQGTATSLDTEEIKCFYCGILNPTNEHLESEHNHGSCQVGGQPPSFIRKDHLVQHLRHVHRVTNPLDIDSCKEEGPPVHSRCGFCNIRMTTWRDRVEHLARHFKAGTTMDQWKGEHDFDPSIAVRVRHAMPPYLIGSEARALVPFSVTSHGTRDHLSQIRGASEQSLDMWRQVDMLGQESLECATAPSSAEDAIGETTDSMMFPDILAIHLARYARSQIRSGIMPTDEMFQNEARRLLFDSVDPWDQTIADNDVWLHQFRDRHLGDSPDGQGEK